MYDNIPLFSWIMFALAGLMALLNGLSLFAACRAGRGTSLVPLVGFIFFAAAMLYWGGAPWYFWLFGLLDLGTPAGLVGLPYLLAAVWRTSLFARCAVYRNREQRLTLYQTRGSRTFWWEYLGSSSTFGLVGFGGEWCVQAGKLCLNPDGPHPIVCTVGSDGSLRFPDGLPEYYTLLNGVCLPCRKAPRCLFQDAA